MSDDIRNMIDRVKNYKTPSEKLYEVFESKFYYSEYKDILFKGSYDDCVKFIMENTHLTLEIKPVNSNQLQETIITETNLAIIGSRTFNNYGYAKRSILDIIQKNKLSVTKIISGGADGADKIAEMFADQFNIPIDVILPDWSIGQRAGLIRNTEIIQKSDYVIAFWDGVSRGTLDSINKSKKANKKLFVIKISPEHINEGIKLNSDNTYDFDFKKDGVDDLLSLTYNKNYITRKISRGVVSYFTYKINPNAIKTKILYYIKDELKKTSQYDHFLNKSVLGLFNNPHINVSDVDLILIPESGSDVNLDLAHKIKNKIPNALFMKDVILKNQPENITVDYDLLKKMGYQQNTIMNIQKMVDGAVVNGAFKMKKIEPRFRRFIINFLKVDITNRNLFNTLVNGKVLIVDDIFTEGTTLREAQRLVSLYAPKEIILFSLIGV